MTPVTRLVLEIHYRDIFTKKIDNLHIFNYIQNIINSILEDQKDEQFNFIICSLHTVDQFQLTWQNLYVDKYIGTKIYNLIDSTLKEKLGQQESFSMVNVYERGEVPLYLSSQYDEKDGAKGGRMKLCRLYEGLQSNSYKVEINDESKFSLYMNLKVRGDWTISKWKDLN